MFSVNKLQNTKIEQKLLNQPRLEWTPENERTEWKFGRDSSEKSHKNPLPRS